MGFESHVGVSDEKNVTAGMRDEAGNLVSAAFFGAVNDLGAIGFSDGNGLVGAARVADENFERLVKRIVEALEKSGQFVFFVQNRDENRDALGAGFGRVIGDSDCVIGDSRCIIGDSGCVVETLSARQAEGKKEEGAHPDQPAHPAVLGPDPCVKITPEVQVGEAEAGTKDQEGTGWDEAEQREDPAEVPEVNRGCEEEEEREGGDASFDRMAVEASDHHDAAGEEEQAHNRCSASAALEEDAKDLVHRSVVVHPGGKLLQSRKKLWSEAEGEDGEQKRKDENPAVSPGRAEDEKGQDQEGDVFYMYCESETDEHESVLLAVVGE